MGVGGTSGAAADPAASSLPAVFSTDQAKKGRQIYSASCADCHGAELEGVAAPALAGPAFVRRGGPPARSASDLLSILRPPMPKLPPGLRSADDDLAQRACPLKR